MRKITFVITLVALYSLRLTAQNCPNASFTVPDSACGGNVLSLANTSTGGTAPLTYTWDFCPGDLTQIPVHDTIGNFGVLAEYTQGMQLIFDGGNWYGFACNAGQKTLTRFDFGNSLLNYPTPVNLGQYTGSSILNDIQIIKENNNWYGFVCTYQGEIFRIDIGPTITNPAPPATYLVFTAGFLNVNYSMKLVKDHNEFKLLLANLGTASISLVNIGTVITNNTPTIGAIPSSFAGNSIYSITAVRDCDRWYAFTSSPYDNTINAIDFGDSITTTPVSITNLGIGNPVGYSNDIEVINDGGKWYAFTLTGSGGSLIRIDLGSPLNTVNPPVINTGVTMDPSEHYFSFAKMSSTWVGITSFYANTSAPDLGRFVFPDNCTANMPGYSGTTPSGLFYNGVGFHQMTLEVTDANGNTAFYTDSSFSKNSPATSFVTSNACAGSPVTFTDSSTIAGATITSWNWDFGDSDTSTQQNPVHTYATAGNYVVTLQTNSSAGCGSSYSTSLAVGTLPTAALSFIDNSCAESSVSFTDVSTSQDPISAWAWDFGDSTSAFLSTPVHVYSIGGAYPVSITVTTNAGCSSTATDTIHIRPKPVTDFSVSNTCIGETVIYTNHSTISDGSALNYFWDLDDLTTTSTFSPTHQYPASVAVYNVSLIASSPNGCSDTLSTLVRIGTPPNPSFSFTPLNVCKGNSVTFSDLSTVSAGGPGDTINTWNWIFGDTYTSNIQNPVHAYQDTGTYIITLVVTTPTACDSSISQLIHVIDAPLAAFNYNDICFGGTTNFIDFSSAPPGSVLTSHVWDFGDSTTASGTTVSHTYSQAGTYTVVLTVTDTFGCTDFVMQLVSVYPIPVASFTNTIACTGTTVYFSNTSTISNGDFIQSYFWDFGDGSTSTDTDPTHTYTGFGSKTVMLIATSAHGCIDTLYQTLFVNQAPNPGFSYSTTCLGQATQFTYVANPFPSTIASYSWSFGDIGTSNQENPLHTYTNAVTYNVTVSVIDITGCPASLTLPVTVNPVPSANFTYSNGCAGIATNFTDSSVLNPGIISNYLWNFGNGNFSSQPSPSFIFDSSGVYDVKLKIISSAGCTDSVSKSVAVVDLPVAGFTMNTNVGAPPFTVALTNTSTNSSTYSWDFGDGSNSNAVNPVHLYADSGQFVIRLIAYNNEGCSDTAYNSVYVIIPRIDLAVLNVNTLKVNGLLSISADLFNYGNITIDNFEIIATLEGGTIVHENYNMPVVPGLLKYDFNAKIEINQYTSPSFVCVEVKNPNGSPDEVPENNKKCTGSTVNFEIITVFNDPKSQQATINFYIPVEDKVTLQIYDITGKWITAENVIQASKGLNTYVFNTQSLTKGFYSCVMKYREEKIAKRLPKF